MAASVREAIDKKPQTMRQMQRALAVRMGKVIGMKAVGPDWGCTFVYDRAVRMVRIDVPRLP